jgi:hypothetical protein
VPAFEEGADKASARNRRLILLLISIAIVAGSLAVSCIAGTKQQPGQLPAKA